MPPIIIEGQLADIDGVRRGQIAIADGVIAAVGVNLGTPTHVFADDCLIFAGMGDIHIHAREDVSQRETYKETFACACAAALNGGVLHVADMPNNHIAPIDDATYAAKEALLLAQQDIDFGHVLDKLNQLQSLSHEALVVQPKIMPTKLDSYSTDDMDTSRERSSKDESSDSNTVAVTKEQTRVDSVNSRFDAVV